MKNNVLLVVLFAVLIFVLPLVGLVLPQTSGAKTPAEAPASSSAAPEGAAQSAPEAASVPTDASEELLIYDEANEKVLTVPMRTFVLGAVAAEMPMTYPDEALKAQAVAAHSYALALKTQGPDATLGGAYFSANPSQRRGYLNEDGMRTMWAGKYAENHARLETLVDSVLREVLTYNDAPALACYHAISSGVTETSEAVWGTAVPYLVSVASPYDTTAEDYASTLTLSAQEFSSGLYLSGTGVQTEGDPSTWLGESKTDAAGYVTSIEVCGASLTGPALRKALGLRSAAFTITYDKSTGFSVTTHGYGHGVGMSQYGASCLANAGKSHADILALYYPGTQLTSAA